MYNSRYANQLFIPPTADPFSVKDHSKRKYSAVESLYVGFDTETTGLLKDFETKKDLDTFPLSFGMCVYRNGVHSPEEDQHFIMLPPPKVDESKPTKILLDSNGRPIRSELSDEAEKVHGLTGDLLAASYQGRIVKDKTGSTLLPAYEHSVGTAKALSLLGQYQKQGAVFVGHNIINFDWPMMLRSHFRATGELPPSTAGLNLGNAMRYSADTLQHAKAMGMGVKGFRRGAGGVLIPVSDSKRLEDLCPHFGIQVGGHAALGDARSSVELLLKQIQLNQEENAARGIKLSSVGPSGVDYSMAGPHDPKGCNFCNHLDKVAAGNMDENGNHLDKDVKKSIDAARGWHVDPSSAKGTHPMSPQLVLTAKKRENNA